VSIESDKELAYALAQNTLPHSREIATCRPLGIRQKKGYQTAVGQKIYSSTSKLKTSEITKYLHGGNKR